MRCANAYEDVRFFAFKNNDDGNSAPVCIHDILFAVSGIGFAHSIH